MAKYQDVIIAGFGGQGILFAGKFLAYKGSVAINGVSLTINEVEDTPAGTRISINLIPHTFEHTAFKHTKKRDLVNVEVDTVARYIERMYSLTEHK